jgi:hypothetical protein
MNIHLSSEHSQHFIISHDSAMNVMYVLMGIMLVFDIGMLYVHVGMHRRVKALEAELASRK